MHDPNSLIGPGQMQVYPSGVGSLPLPFLKENAIAEFVLPNGRRIAASIDRAGALLVWAPGAGNAVEIIAQPDLSSVRLYVTTRG